MISAVVLAGGQAARMGYTQKALELYQGYPLLDHVLVRIRPQVDEILLNVQADKQTEYGHYGYPLISDLHDHFMGPLAGVYIGLQMCTHEWLLTVPCDTPHLPSTLVAQLTQHQKKTSQCIVAVTKSGRQSVCMLVHKSSLNTLHDYLAQGLSKVESWQQLLRTELCYFDDEYAFKNINTLQELKD